MSHREVVEEPARSDPRARERRPHAVFSSNTAVLRGAAPLDTPPTWSRCGVSKPADPAEQEADRIARKIMQMPDLEVSPSSQHLIASPRPGPGREVDRQDLPPIVKDVASSSGDALDNATRAFLEPRFGHDLSQIRVHSNAGAAQSATALDALAYTVGRSVVFAAGQFAPHTNPGMALLAHEIAHAVAPLAGSQRPRIYRSEIPLPLDMTTEAQVGHVFDRIASGSGVQVASEVNIAVQDQAANWVLGRIDKILRLPDGTIKGVELKLDVTSSRTVAQEIYIPLVNQGYVVEITGHAADVLGLPRGTRLTLSIVVISSENVATAMEMLGLRPPPTEPTAPVRVPGGRTPRAPSAFETAPESLEQVPRSPSAVRQNVPPSPVKLGPRVLAFEVTEPSMGTGTRTAGGMTTATGLAMPVVGIASELMVGEDMARIRRIMGHSLAPNAEEQEFMRSWGFGWQDEKFSYEVISLWWRLYWIGKWILNPMVLIPEYDPNATPIA